MMRNPIQIGARLLAVALFLTWSSPAAAAYTVASGGGLQSGTAQMTLPSISKAGGLRSGDFVLSPSISLGGNHDTNVFNGNTDEPNNQPVTGTSMRIMPRLRLNNGASSEVQFNFETAGDIRLYLSDNPTLKQLNNLGGNADLGVTFAARRAISFSVFDHFVRALRANNWETTETLNRVANDVGARVSFHPGEIPERRPLEVSLMGSYAIDRFEELDIGDTNTIRTRLTSSWRFLPKTAVILDAGWDFRDFKKPNQYGLSANSKPWRVQGGVAGALTKKMTMRLTGGWGMSLHDVSDSDPLKDEKTFTGFIGGASLGFRASASTLLHVAYTRDFRDAYYGNFVSFHRGSVNLNQRFGTMLDVTAYFRVTYGTYGTYVPTMANVKLSQKNRIDMALDGGLTANFEVSRLVAMDIGYRLRGVVTNFKISTMQGQGGAEVPIDVGGYMAHELFAGVTLRY